MRKIALVGILLLGFFGTGVGGLMTWHHDMQLYGTETIELIGCVESAQVNCDIVNTSEWSEPMGIPLATLAIPFYLSMSALAALGLAGHSTGGLLLGGGVFSVLLSGFLYYISTTELGYLCAWCLRLYGVNIGLLVLGTQTHIVRPPAATLRYGIGLFAGLLVLSIGGERLYRRSLGWTGALETSASADLKTDPKGTLLERTLTVTTEDGNTATFKITPDDAWKGNPKAKIEVVEFADLQCGYCKRTATELKKLYSVYSDRVLFVFKHFPMNPNCNPGVKNNKHRYACDAARASVCAQKQQRFWAFHDLAFKNQHQLGAEYLLAYAKEVGVEEAAFSSCLKDPASLASVREDAEVGASLDIHGTPRIFINGKLYRSGSSAESLARAIEEALGASKEDASKAALALKSTDSPVSAIPADVPLMRQLNGFSIDTFEAGIQDGKATVGKHQIPAIRSSWFAAKAACEAAGKRLCTEAEWVEACQGAKAVDDNGNGEFADDMIEGTAYPYGDFHEDNRCWDDKDDDKKGAGFRPVYTGEMPGCVTPTGIYDLTGNVEEWVGESPEKAVLLGGAWDTTEDHARCYRRNDTFGPGYASPRTGFRCCR
jgi:protein-disulfide isomerase/uncharacterized membrane protein